MVDWRQLWTGGRIGWDWCYLHTDNNMVLSVMNPNSDVLMIQITLPLFLIGFAVVAKTVAKLLPSESLPGWKVGCIGVFVAIFGAMIAAYFSAVEVGAAVGLIGCLIVFIGGVKFSAAWIANSKK